MSAINLALSLLLLALSFTFSSAAAPPDGKIHVYIANLVGNKKLTVECRAPGGYYFNGPLAFGGLHEVVLNSNKDWCGCDFSYDTGAIKRLVIDMAVLYDGKDYPNRCITSDCYWVVAMNGLSLLANDKLQLIYQWREI